MLALLAGLHPLQALSLSLPLALGGEAPGSEGTGLAIVSLVSMASGYVLLAALWYFVFRPGAREKRRRGRRRD